MKFHGGKRDCRTWGWRSILVLLVVFGLGPIGASWLIAYLMLHPSPFTRRDVANDPPISMHNAVSFTTVDGVTLRGWYLPGRANATVILVHGFARDRRELLPEAYWLMQQGYSALLFDLRGHGMSEGNHIGFGYLEALDVSAAVDFIHSRSSDERIGILGYSMGAVAAIQAAAVDDRIHAMIAVSPFSTLRETVYHRLNHARPLAPLIIWWGERMTGLHLDDLRPLDVIADIAPRPILIMEAGNDKMVPFDSGRRLYEAAGEPKELWSVPGIAHVDFRQAQPTKYRQRVIGFFEQHLGKAN